MAAPQHALYLPRLVLDWLRDAPDTTSDTLHGTLIFADVSGFTALSDRLATEMGRSGSEAVTSVMNEAFSELVEIVFLEHGDLLRFGGDALVALFTGDHHVGRACRAAVDMREAISEIDAGDIDLDISIGIAAGDIYVDLIGQSHREMVLSGPAVDGVIGAESAASAGQIFAGADLEGEVADVASLDESGFWKLEDDPDTAPFLDEPDDLKFSSDGSFSDFISPDFRDLLTLTLQQGEHRPASIGFVKFSGLGALSDEERREALETLFYAITTACTEHDVAYVSNDIDEDGGKFILAAGVPRRSSGAEGMALALYDIVSIDHAIKVSGGCARGYVFSGDLGAPSRRVFTVMGDTVNLSARLAAAAERGQVLITEAALERSLGEFETNRLDALSLKGKSKDVSPFEIIAATSAGESTADIPLFGRDEEVRNLRQLLSSGTTAPGLTIALVADDGIGKGHLITVAIADASDRVIQPSVSNQAHSLSRALLGILAEIEHTDDALDRLAEICNDKAPHLTEWIPLLARNWGLDVPDTETSASLGPEFVANRIAQLTAELLLAVAGHEATTIVVEDFDLIDRPSQLLVEQLTSKLEDVPWTLVVTSQTEPDLGQHPVTVMRIEPFDEETARGFVRWVLGDDVLPASAISLIVQRGQGNPHVLSELTKSAIEGGTVPESIEAAALSKLDRLDPRDKQLLMYAAVLGTEARIDLLASLLPEIASAIEDSESWNRLAEFIDTSVIGKIKFQDPLVRDVAYEMLPKRRREEIHELVGDAIEKRARRRPERFVDDLSYHYHLAGDWQRSLNYSQMAAERAERSYALVAASEFWKRSIEASEELNQPDSDRTRLHERLGDTNEHGGLFPQAQAAFETAIELTDDDIALARLSRKLGLVQVRLGFPLEARERFDAILASPHAETEDRLEAMLGIAGMETRIGHPADASDWCDKVLQEAGHVDYPPQRARAYHIMSVASTELGNPDAVDQAKQALYIYEEINDQAGASKALNNLGYHAFYKGNWAACEEYHLKNREATEELGDLLNRALAGYNLGELYLEQGRFEEGRPLLEETLAAFRGASHKVGEAVTRIGLGRLEARVGNHDQARAMLERALAIAEEANAFQYRQEVGVSEIELALLRGELADARNRAESLAEAVDEPNLRARLLALYAYAHAPTASTEDLRSTLEEAATVALGVGALHLEFGVVEAQARLLNEGADRVQHMADQLQIQARPLFKTREIT